MSLIDEWVAYCADPRGPHLPPPRRRLPSRYVNRLICQAEAHGVLGALLRNFPEFDSDTTFVTAREAARIRNRANAAFSLLLARETDSLIPDLNGVEATIVKGPVFARALYPVPSLRCFTDIDILASGGAVPRLGQILADRGFYLAERRKREFKWLHRDNDRVMIEVQTDLIHADTLHRSVSLSYETIAESPTGADALLIVALIHGAGHQYDRLQHLVDICQAARALKAVDEPRFEAMLERSNARFVAIFGLLLADRIFDEPRCREIAQSIGSSGWHAATNRLLDRTVIMSTTDSRRPIFKWRRLIFRWLMRVG